MIMKIHGNSAAAATGLTVLAPIAWGTTYITVTELLPAGRPLLVATMRVLPAGLDGRRAEHHQPGGNPQSAHGRDITSEATSANRIRRSG